MENWKDIENYEGLYSVSDQGNVRVEDREVTDYRGTYIRKGKMLTPDTDKDGYLIATLRKESKAKRLRIHRLVAIHFIENPEDKPVVDHIDNNKQNNTKENLRWCTVSENTKWSYEDGCQKPKIGEAHYNSKLTEDDVTTIKWLLSEGNMKQVEIAKQFNISPSRITEIKKGTTWK